MEQTVTVETTGTTMDVYDAVPEGEVRGAVVLFQEAFGVNDHIQDVARRFAAAGYRTVAPHIFHRTGDPTIAYDDMGSVVPHAMALELPNIDADLQACIDYLGRQGFAPGQIGMVGFCLGGSITSVEAARQALGAAVAFYGGGIAQGRFGAPGLAESAPDLTTPWLAFFGDQDQGIPVEEVEQLRAAAAGASVDAEVVRYPDAEHGFHCDARSSYHEASATDAWQRTLQWLDGHLDPA